ncbi:MAG: prepilin-type N-terminal cleavage/methylation domain-containing protein [Verrucomicrobiae bacterium]|nr:prepilin-type N-terminal cleavage/methylation domain-containing protein [Verrucomicrobiae bacterium]
MIDDGVLDPLYQGTYNEKRVLIDTDADGNPRKFMDMWIKPDLRFLGPSSNVDAIEIALEFRWQQPGPGGAPVAEPSKSSAPMSSCNKRMARRRSRPGFTLTELMVSTTIMGMLGLGIYRISTEGVLDLFVSTEKLEINHDVRYLTARLAEDAIGANQFLIYPSFEPATATPRATVAARARPGTSCS